MIKLTIEGNPIPKLRPRFAIQGFAIKTYDKQTKEKKLARCLIMQELSRKGILKRLQSPISVGMTFHTPKPKSWSQKRSIAAEGKPDPTRPDLDNYAKFYCDMMNDLVYQDDNLITELWCEKTYSDKPRTEIFIIELKDGEMIKEHATTVKGEITLEDLNYMVKKANKLGLKDREVFRVFMEEDDEGKHVYFDCTGPKGMEESDGSGV